MDVTDASVPTGSLTPAATFWFTEGRWMSAYPGETEQAPGAPSGQPDEALRTLLQTLMDSTPDWIFAKDLQHRFLFVNRAFAAAQGSVPDEMVGRCDTEFFGLDQCEPNPATGHRGLHEDDRQAFAGAVVRNPHSEATTGGQRRVFDTVKTPLRTPDGRIIGVLSYSRDVTEQRKTDQALRESEERLRAIVEGEPECVKLLDRDGNLLDMNAAGLRMLQADTLEQVRGQCVCPLVAPRDEPAFREMIAAVFRGESQILVFDLVGLKGVRRTLETHSVPLWEDAEHTSVRALLGVTRDITDRVAAEEALRKSEAQLVEAQRIAGIGSWQLSVDTGELSWSEGAYRVLELSPRGPGVTYESFLACVHPDDRDLVRRTYATSVEQRVPYDLVHRLLMPDGRVKFVHERCETRYDADGHPTVSLGTVQDITERRQAEQTRLALEAQLRQAQKLEALGTLVGGIAHDFNNILTAILGHAEWLASELPAASTLRAGVDSILDASHRARELVQQTLTFSRRREHERQVITLQPVVIEALQMLRPSLPTSIEIRTLVTDEQACVLADATQVHQGVMNLCTNAAHAMRDTGGVLSVTYDVVQVDEADARRHPGLTVGRYARLTVSDTGHGMDAATVDRIFDPFFTTKAPGEGTGLGLAVTHGIMQAHEGQVIVSSEPGVGTSFSLYFPICGEAAPEPPDEHRDIPRGRGEHILVVDDEPILVSLALRMLTQLGYQATGHTRPADALEEFRRDTGRFALVLSDLTMPQMSGMELAAHLRRERPGIPVVLTSGYGGALGPEELSRVGVRELLGKPFTLRTMAEVTQRNLRQAG